MKKTGAEPLPTRESLGYAGALLVFALGSGCGSNIVDGSPTHLPDAAVTGCNEVTSQGTCEALDLHQFATTCDLASNEIRRIDCTALKLECKIDALRGASCIKARPAPPDAAVPMETPDLAGDAMGALDLGSQAPDLAGTPCPPNLQQNPTDGECGGTDGNTARWCDGFVGGFLHEESCTAVGKTCIANYCDFGSRCCPTPKPSAECGTMAKGGLCSGFVARWCSEYTSTGILYQEDCSYFGEVCAVNGNCGSGARCCSF